MPLPRYRIRTLMIAVAVVAAGLGVAVRPGLPRAVKATSTNLRVAVRQEKRLDGVLWGLSYDAALEQAQYEGRPFLVYFSGLNDANGRFMEMRIFPRDEIVPLLSHFVTVRLDVDLVPIGSLTTADREALAEENLARREKLTGEMIAPYFIALSEQGQVLASQAGTRGPKDFAAFLDFALKSHRRGPSSPTSN